MPNYTKQKRDNNEKEIEERFNNAGCFCQHMPRECGFDLLVHGLFPFALPVEIKTQKGTLTDNEIKTRQKILDVWGLYCVIRFGYQADNLLSISANATLHGWSVNRIRAAIKLEEFN